MTVDIFSSLKKLVKLVLSIQYTFDTLLKYGLGHVNLCATEFIGVLKFDMIKLIY